MARRRDQIVIGIIVAGFVLSSFGGIALIIWGMMQSDDKAAGTSSLTEANTNDKQLQGNPMDNFEPVAKIETLKAVDLQPGTGTEVKAGDTVTVDYTGAVAATGKVFQSSLDSGEPITFALDGVIAGWSQGLPGMKVGGKRRLLIPASLAYAGSPPDGSGIPVDADLVFDITLHTVGQ